MCINNIDSYLKLRLNINSEFGIVILKKEIGHQKNIFDIGIKGIGCAKISHNNFSKLFLINTSGGYPSE